MDYRLGNVQKMPNLQPRISLKNLLKMTNQIYPCLWFDGQAKAAADFYCSIFKQSKITDENPMVVRWDINGQQFMGLNGGPMFSINPSISFYVACETAEEVTELWEQLFEGGSAMIALGTYPWSEKYGWLKDRFGTTWQITLDKNMAQKITPSLLFTQKQHGRGEEAVNFYTSLFANSSVEALAKYQKGQNDYATEGMVLFANFLLNSQSFNIMDAGFPQPYTFNEGVSFVVTCENQAEIDYYWQKLTENGGVESQCGWLKDKFGVSWQIVPSVLAQLMGDPQKAPRVVQAFMKMTKFDIATLMNA
jgi:predicted 3-demethylubiquinone-9 3-methyltransferase (glyoxalase superfamily)